MRNGLSFINPYPIPDYATFENVSDSDLMDYYDEVYDRLVAASEACVTDEQIATLAAARAAVGVDRWLEAREVWVTEAQVANVKAELDAVDAEMHRRGLV